MQQIIFYTTSGCHLCEQAEDLLQLLVNDMRSEQQFKIHSVDIADDEKLVELYGIRIPVIKNPVTLAELAWPFDTETLKRFLHHAGFC